MEGVQVTGHGPGTGGPAPHPAPRIDLHDPVQRRAVEVSLTEMPGIRAARLVPGFERPVDELHIVAAVDRAPKQLVRDVQTVLMAEHGIPTDHRVISVAQLADGAGVAGSGRPLTVRRVTVSNERLASVAEVVLATAEDELEGRDQGPSSAVGRRRAVARATLAALRPLLPVNRTVELEGVELVDVVGSAVALCVVHVHGTSGGHPRSGSAVVDGDENDAVARAVLDATNRLVGAP